jgi:hypothetical protein
MVENVRLTIRQQSLEKLVELSIQQEIEHPFLERKVL